MKQQTKASPVTAPADLDALRSREMEAITARDVLQKKRAELERRLDNPQPSETEQSLIEAEQELRRVRVAMALAIRDCESATAARAAAEAEAALSEYWRDRKERERRVEEFAISFRLEFNQGAQAMLRLLMRWDEEEKGIRESNKMRPEGVDPMPSLEERLRWPAPDEKGVRSYFPSPLTSVFEIPALQPGDADYRVPGTRPPGGIWFTASGRPRQ